MSEFDKCRANIDAAKTKGVEMASREAGGILEFIDPNTAMAYELGYLKGKYEGHVRDLEEQISALKRELNTRIPVVMA